MPAYIFSDAFDLSAFFNRQQPKKAAPPVNALFAAQPGGGVSHAPFAAKAPVSKSPALPLPALQLARPSMQNSLESTLSAPMTEKRSALARLYHEVKSCQQCGLGKLRNHFVFGTGNTEALFMVIGEAPGREEDMQGQPFVGAAGELLTKMLAAISVDRKKQAFITNVVKCRPPQNRNPETAEILSCSGILSKQIAIIAPKVILLLGKVAAHALLNSTESISQLRGRTHAYNDIPVFVTYHPAALLRNDAYRRPAWEDLQNLKTTLKNVGVYDAPTP
jgi:DNA polymerase